MYLSVLKSKVHQIQENAANAIASGALACLTNRPSVSQFCARNQIVPTHPYRTINNTTIKIDIIFSFKMAFEYRANITVTKSGTNVNV
ncbi:Uncharacterized protein OBRU01_19666 [Operophtera brumata]|uniref:Uncharacterized protein n=1 Tax=Operophtera brumata TaxID=104452 RepID=A0A0L7KP55_OPEBR|nr:Uncharacterized protein OBRU01_19666 [Operophtera brumata]